MCLAWMALAMVPSRPLSVRLVASDCPATWTYAGISDLRLQPREVAGRNRRAVHVLQGRESMFLSSLDLSFSRALSCVGVYGVTLNA